MIRGGHVDATMIGTLQVDGEGNIANYEMPGRKIGMGGAMDLVTGAQEVFVLTEHCAKTVPRSWSSRCTLPLTGAANATSSSPRRALFRRFPGRGFVLEEVACGYTPEDVRAATAMQYSESDAVKLDAYGPVG